MLLMGAIAASGRVATLDPPDLVPSRETYMSAGGNPQTLSTNSSTLFFACAGGLRQVGTENDAKLRIPKAGKLKKLRLHVETNSRITNSSVTLVKNGANSALSVSIPAGVTGWIDAPAFQIPVTTDDEINYRFQTGTGGGTITIRNVFMVYEADDTATCFFTLNQPSSVQHYTSGGSYLQTSYYYGIEGYGRTIIPGWGQEWNNISNPTRTLLRAEGVLSRLSIRVTANSCDAPFTVTITENGVDTPITISVPAATTGVFTDTTHTHTVSPGSFYSYRLSSPGRTTGGVNFSLLNVVFSSTNGEWDVWSGQPHNATTGGGTQAVENFAQPGARHSPITTEALGQFKMPFAGEARRFMVMGAYNSGSGSTSFDVATRKNGVTQNQKITVPNGEFIQTFNATDSINPVSFAKDDLFGAVFTPPANAGGPYHIGWTLFSEQEEATGPAPMTTPLNGARTSTAVTVTGAAASTRFLNFGALAPYSASDFAPVAPLTEGTWRTRVPADGLIDGLSVYVESSNRASTTAVALMVNGVASQSQVLTLPASTTGWVTVPLGNPQAVFAGDLISVRFTSGTNTGSATVSAMEATYEPLAGGAVMHHMLAGDYAFAQSVANTNPWHGPMRGNTEGNTFVSGWEQNSSATTYRSRIQTPGTAKRMAVDVPTNSSTVSVNVTLYKNGLATALSVTIPAGTTGSFTNDASEVALVAGDAMEWRWAATAAGTGTFVLGNIQFSIHTENEYDVFAAARPLSGLQGYQSAPHYLGSGVFGPFATDNTFGARLRAPVAGVIKKMYVSAAHSSAPSPYDYTVQKNGVNTALDLTAPAETGTHYLTDAFDVPIVRGDRITCRFQTAAFSQAPYSWGYTVGRPT